MKIRCEAHHGAAETLSVTPPLIYKCDLTFLSAPHLSFPHPTQGFVLPFSSLGTTSLVVVLSWAGSLLKFSGGKRHLLLTLNLVTATFVLTETSQPCGEGAAVIFGKFELTPFL